MKTLAQLVLAIAFAATAAAQPSLWLERGFERIEIRPLSLDLPPPARSGYAPEAFLNLTLVLLEGSNWTAARVRRHVRKTAAVFAQCGIGLGAVRLVKARAPDRVHDIDMIDRFDRSALPRQVAALSGMVPPKADWPVVFFVGRLLGDAGAARSYRRGDVPTAALPRYPYMNTAWIAFRTHWIERRELEYSTLAHELGHLLCECGHQGGEQPHLLHEYRNFLSPEILPEHCAAFRRSPLLSTLEGSKR